MRFISIICLPKLDRAEPKKRELLSGEWTNFACIKQHAFYVKRKQIVSGETHWLIKKPPEYRRVTVTFNALKK